MVWAPNDYWLNALIIPISSENRFLPTVYLKKLGYPWVLPLDFLDIITNTNHEMFHISAAHDARPLHTHPQSLRSLHTCAKDGRMAGGY